jgi:hypothetical protein
LVIFWAIIIFTILLNRIMSIKKILIYTLPIIFVLGGFELFYFHSIIPESISAKSVVYQVEPGVTFIHAVVGFNPFVLQIDQISVELRVFGIALTFLLFYLFFQTWVLVHRKIRFTWDWQITNLYALSGIIIISLYTIEHILMFAWYTPLFTVPIVLGMMKFYLSSTKKTFQVVGIIIGVLYLSGFIQQSYIALSNPKGQSINVYQARVKTYIDTGKELYQQFPQQTLLSAEIGGLGWGFKGKIIDAVGLVSPDALPYHPLAVPNERSDGKLGAIPVKLVTAKQPGLVVSYDCYSEQFRRSLEANNYDRIQKPGLLVEDRSKITGDFCGSEYLSVYYRKGLLKEK